MTVKEKIELLPHSPGVYRYSDSSGTIIYVGKAKDLYKRVHQYFVPPERLNVKTRILVSKIADVQYSVVNSEADALLLENNLIKQYKPRYNILLKDSKTYPWICVRACSNSSGATGRCAAAGSKSTPTPSCAANTAPASTIT